LQEIAMYEVAHTRIEAQLRSGSQAWVKTNPIFRIQSKSLEFVYTGPRVE
jgi:hypothetical protein